MCTICLFEFRESLTYFPTRLYVTLRISTILARFPDFLHARTDSFQNNQFVVQSKHGPLGARQVVTITRGRIDSRRGPLRRFDSPTTIFFERTAVGVFADDVAADAKRVLRVARYNTGWKWRSRNEYAVRLFFAAVMFCICLTWIQSAAVEKSHQRCTV